MKIGRINLSFFLRVSWRAGLLLCAGFSALALCAALVGQYGFALHPCDLCIYQRIPYAAVVLLGGLGALLRLPVWQRRLFAVCVVLFAVDAGIASYHTGVELGVFPGPTACSSGEMGEQTLEEMRAAILNAPLVTCSQAMFYLLGLSMAAWNALAASLAFVLGAVWGFGKRRSEYAADRR